MIHTVRSRVRHLLSATVQEADHLLEDLQLFVKRRNGHCALRQAHLDGVNLLVRADEDLGRAIYFFHEHEASDAKFILQNLRRGDVCVDVGANVGYYTMLLGTKVGAGTVHAFEPVDLTYHVLAVNVLTNKLSNVVLNNCAVGDRDEEVDFFVAEDGGFSSTINTGRRQISSKRRVPMVTLDSYCSDAGLSKVDFLKVDVEGGEQHVIQGAHELLTDHERKPHLVMLELYNPMLSKFGTSVRNVISIMNDYGYKAHICQGEKLRPFSEEHHTLFFNVFFTT